MEIHYNTHTIIMQTITLHLPADTPVPVIGGTAELIQTPLGPRWARRDAHRYCRLQSGKIEASYTLEQLEICVGVADYVLDNRLSL